ncbi:DNA polymerase delta subunit 4 isoform X1 [Clupea harengus]|uniref:DNA polymerase delta subunit 4 isoform X1 n=1 Tax=Clupea harengus TaxID=7950 RepID=A0A6P8ETX7_CLUHA|nr:DNA polymerase delta subunit 4 isoform X1 [Clupea harengus]XP_031415594.1 DNA polymerase delta subunit 4 isoform X1 [Clupea harengus]XP_031415596.1 DNA polymerase delta subunit 4 isoform X1 [Clupea harengus]XP_031415597.1 DNA polymerase delta subunit 4 isoform X1 [Clupea harengus]
MTVKQPLIKDIYKAVKKGGKEDTQGKKSPPPPPPPEPGQREVSESPQLSERERELLELKKFDLNWHFGPCTGISRLQRWDRATLHGLDPPQEIRDLLLNRENDPDYSHCLWRDYPL